MIFIMRQRSKVCGKNPRGGVIIFQTSSPVALQAEVGFPVRLNNPDGLNCSFPIRVSTAFCFKLIGLGICYSIVSLVFVFFSGSDGEMWREFCSLGFVLKPVEYVPRC